MTFIILLAVALAVAYRVMTAAERERFTRFAAQVTANALHRADIEAFRAILRARTPLAPVTPTLAALNATIFVAMLLGPRLLGDPDTLVAWGGNLGPRTANGEWWRLITALFVHSSLLHLLGYLVSLVPLGLILERLVGPVAFAAVYLASGLFSGLFSISAFPMTVSAGASGAIAGVYALMLAASMWGVINQPRLKIPLVAVKWLAGSLVVFIAYTLATGTLAAALVGFLTGLLFGLVVARNVNERRAPAVRVAAIVATTIFIAIATAVPLRGITDARPEIEGIVAIEERTSKTYRTAADQFKTGRISAEALAKVIDAIMPELRAGRTRLELLDKLPREQQQLVAAAEEYLRLRDESWRIRSEALRSHSMRMLREADEKESAALQALPQVN
jgi:rhomboid protease GluP